MKSTFAILLALGFCLAFFSHVHADTPTNNATSNCPPGTPNEYTCLASPIAAKDVPSLLGSIIKYALGIVGSAALLMFVLGGFWWLTSGGNEERIARGTKTMLWAAIGVAAVLASWFILNAYTAYLSAGAFPR